MENKKINIAELLKNCPPGMELDCTIYENCEFLNIDTSSDSRSIRIKTPDGQISLNKYGCYHNTDKAKCVIFPKGKTTWEGFQGSFKDGDIVATESGDFIGITSGGEIHELMPTYCIVSSNDNFGVYLECKPQWRFARLATEEEKQKLLDAIKDNGYKWNAETKTLEKLVEPKFKVGDTITDGEDSFTIDYMDNECYYDIKVNTISRLFIKYQDNWELVPNKSVPKFKVGDRIKTNEYEYIIVEIKDDYYLTECGNKIHIKNQDYFKLVPNKFDISTLVPFETKVLVRDHKNQFWKPAIFGGYIDDYREQYKYAVVGGSFYKYLIPYKGNEHLRCKIDDCDKYYKVW